MTYQNFTLETDADGILLVTWDMPGKSMNVIDLQVMDEWEKIVDHVAASETIKGVVVTSAKKNFGAGADLAMMQGMLADYWRLWSEKTGIRIQFEPYPWHTCMARVREGQSDMIPGMFYSAERDASLDFSQSFMQIKTSLFTRNSSTAAHLDDLEGMRVGATGGIGRPVSRGPHSVSSTGRSPHSVSWRIEC